MANFPEPVLETCETCGAEFTCGALGCGSCWCAAVPVKLPVTGTRCLCPACLAARIAAVSGPQHEEGVKIGVETGNCGKVPSRE